MRPKILILDDEPDVLGQLAIALRDAPFDVVFSASGLDTLITIFEAYAEGNPFDALVLDLSLPRFDGFTIARIVRIAEVTGISSRAKIAYFSGHMKTVEQTTMLEEVGAEAYWRKPEDVPNLPTLIRLWLENGKDEWANSTHQKQSSSASGST